MILKGGFKVELKTVNQLYNGKNENNHCRYTSAQHKLRWAIPRPTAAPRFQHENTGTITSLPKLK